MYDGYSSELFIEVGIRMMFALMHENTWQYLYFIKIILEFN